MLSRSTILRYFLHQETDESSKRGLISLTYPTSQGLTGVRKCGWGGGNVGGGVGGWILEGEAVSPLLSF